MPGGYALYGYSLVGQNRNSKRSRNVKERETKNERKRRARRTSDDAAHALANISPV